MNIRKTELSDIPALQHVLNEIGLFPAEMLPEMFESSEVQGPEHAIWLTCEERGEPTAFCFAEKEALTQGTWNMRAIAVLPTAQRAGAGRHLVEALEAGLSKQGQSLLIVDTSSANAFAHARAFYRSCNYEQEARIRDFWSPGDDKISFRKVLD